MRTPVRSLDQLAHLLMYNINTNTKLSSIIPIVNSYQGTDWKKYIRAKKGCCYRRSMVYAGEKFDIYVLTWFPGNIAKLHDHPEQGCVMKILQGEITERRYKKDKDEFSVSSSSVLHKGQLGYMNKTGLHSIENHTDDISVSLHVYAPAGYTPQFFETT